MTATEKLTLIEARLAQGATVYLTTALKSIKLTPKNAARFTATGHPIVKVSGASLYVAEGRHYVCADYCGISTEAR